MLNFQPKGILNSAARRGGSFLRHRKRIVQVLPNISVRCDCSLGHPVVSDRALSSKDSFTIRFVWATEAINWGSTWVRSHQLAAMLQSFDKSLDVASLSTGAMAKSRITPDAVVLHKSALRFPGLPNLLRRFKRNGARVYMDLVDGNPTSGERIHHLVDHFICASHSEFAHRQLKLQSSTLVPHHVDHRFPPYHGLHDAFRVGFSGLPLNALHLNELHIETFDSSATQFGADFEKLRAFLNGLSHHYSVRHYQDYDGFKPGLKIYIAAHMGAAFIGSRQDPETLAVLGDDYPYLADDSSLGSVKKTLLRAESTFLSPLHSKALAALNKLRSEFCPAFVVATLHNALKDGAGAQQPNL